jgi:hypothetical protein
METTAATPAAQIPKISRLNRFLEKHCRLICLCLVVLGCFRIVSTYNALSLTSDEPIHFACGLQYLANHVYAYETQHPPLARAMVALGPYLAGARPIGIPNGQDEGYEVISRSGNIDRTIFLMRLGNLPFFVLACWVVYRWSQHAFGKTATVCAVGLFTFLPTILADAGLATTDMALGATVGAAFLSAVLWAERPTYLRSAQLGFFAALACLSKFTALGYVPAAVCLALAAYLAVSWPGWRRLLRLSMRRVPTLAFASVVAFLTIWAGYWFHVGWQRLPYTHHARLIPAPEFLDGIREALFHNNTGHASFLLGQISTTGWWYYFPVALLVKTPTAVLILVALGMYVCCKKWRSPLYWLPVAFCTGILVLAMRGHIDIGIRHIEPIYIGISILAAVGLAKLLEWGADNTRWSFVAGALVLWTVISTGAHHPDYISYFNESAIMGPENILVDSNYDWGQDLRALSRRLRQAGAKRVSVALLWRQKRDIYLEKFYGLPPIDRTNDFTPSPGWTAVSPTYDRAWRIYAYGSDSRKFWYDQIPPTERVGTMRLYYVPEQK